MTNSLHRLPAVLFVAAFASLLSTFAFADQLQGRVVGITDGDTITLLDSSNGQASKQNLSGLIFGKSVTVEFSKRDRYGRTVGRVLLAGRDINLEQVRSGYAWHYKQYEREQTPAERKAYAEGADLRDLFDLKLKPQGSLKRKRKN